MIHVFPGMGATREMYSGPWQNLPNAIFHNWPKNFSGTTITDLAHQLIHEHTIEADDILIGSSLGGIVACEIANQIPISKLILLGSATSKEEVNHLLSFLHPLIDLAPLPFIQRLSSSIPHELSTMFSETDPQFIRRLCKAIFKWNGLQANVPVLRIHGSNNQVIPIPHTVDLELKTGHLIAMTHPQDCIDAILYK